jgi:hypothetical protein
VAYSVKTVSLNSRALDPPDSFHEIVQERPVLVQRQGIASLPNLGEGAFHEPSFELRDESHERVLHQCGFLGIVRRGKAFKKGVKGSNLVPGQQEKELEACQAGSEGGRGG